MTVADDLNLELIPLAAAGALDPEARAAFDAHVEGCGACREELRTYETVAARLPLALAPVPPSARLRRRVMAAVQPQPAGRVPRRVGLPAWLASAAALVLAVAFLATWAMLQAARNETAALQARLAEAESFRELLARPDSRTAVLAGTPQAPRARAHVVWSVPRGQAVMLASGLDPAPPGKAYEVWVIGAGSPMPAGVFQPDAAGRAIVRLPPVGEMASVRTFAVTLEPEAGTPAPTGPMILVGAVS